MISENVKRDIANLSSGTISSLSGEVRYKKLDKIQDDFYLFACITNESCESWVDVWELYSKELAVK